QCQVAVRMDVRTGADKDARRARGRGASAKARNVDLAAIDQNTAKAYALRRTRSGAGAAVSSNADRAACTDGLAGGVGDDADDVGRARRAAARAVDGDVPARCAQIAGSGDAVATAQGRAGESDAAGAGRR